MNGCGWVISFYVGAAKIPSLKMVVFFVCFFLVGWELQKGSFEGSWDVLGFRLRVYEHEGRKHDLFDAKHWYSCGIH